MLPSAASNEVLSAWVAATAAYRYVVDAAERGPEGRMMIARLAIEVDPAAHREVVHVLRGNGAGTEIAWSGGGVVRVRPRGVLHVVPWSLPLRDPRVLSPRGNDVRVGLLGEVAACLGEHRVTQTPRPDGTLALEAADPAGFRCAGTAVPATRERIVVAPDGTPRERERYVGSVLVESWTITDFHRADRAAAAPRPPAFAQIPLVDQTGRAFRLADLAGRRAILTFVATRCEDTCPLVNALFARLARAHVAAQLVTITLDPQYDTPFVMARFARMLEAQPPRWRLAGGTPGDIARVLHAFGVTVDRDRDGVPEAHSTFIYVFNRAGRLAATIPLSSNAFADVLASLK